MFCWIQNKLINIPNKNKNKKTIFKICKSTDKTLPSIGSNILCGWRNPFIWGKESDKFWRSKPSDVEVKLIPLFTKTANTKMIKQLINDINFNLSFVFILLL